MIKVKALLICLLLVSGAMFAQDNAEFIPSGKPFARIYTNFNYKYSGGEGSPAFQIKRAYLGYSYDFSPNFSAKINIDVDNPVNDSKLEMTAFLKNAYLQYQKNGLKLILV